MDHLPKFHLNQTVNELRNVVLRKLCKLEKRWRLAPRNQEPGAWRYKTSGWQILFRKNMKNSVFHESEHHASLVWRLAANWLPLGDFYCSRNPKIFSTLANLIPSPTILIPLDLQSNRLHSRVYIHYSFIRLLHIRNSTNLTT